MADDKWRPQQVVDRLLAANYSLKSPNADLPENVAKRSKILNDLKIQLALRDGKWSSIVAELKADGDPHHLTGELTYDEFKKQGLL